MTDIEEMLASETEGVQRAVRVMRLCISLYGGRDGEGLFTGVARYTTLGNRTRLAAVTSRSVAEFWDRLARSMCWGLKAMSRNREILNTIAPAESDSATLKALADQTQYVVMCAREINKASRVTSDDLHRPDAPHPQDQEDSVDGLFEEGEKA